VIADDYGSRSTRLATPSHAITVNPADRSQAGHPIESRAQSRRVLPTTQSGSDGPRCAPMARKSEFGQVLLLGPSFYMRRRIGARRWRSLHRLTIVAWLLSVGHTLGAGTDAAQLWLRVVVIAPGSRSTCSSCAPRAPAHASAAIHLRLLLENPRRARITARSTGPSWLRGPCLDQFAAIQGASGDRRIVSHVRTPRSDSGTWCTGSSRS
jgi:hypothetical protein